MKRACKQCNTVFEGNKCPNCESTEHSDSWKGRVVILNTEKSEIAQKLKINKAGTYAIKTG